jgi:hypothetical protein
MFKIILHKIQNVLRPSPVLLMLLFFPMIACKEPLVYTARNGATISYNANWLPTSMVLEDVFFMLFVNDKTHPPGLYEWIKMTETTEKDRSIDFDAMVIGNKKYASANNIKFLEEEVTEIDGKPAFRIVYNSVEQGRQLKLLQYLQIFDHQFYSLTFTARTEQFDLYKADAEDIIRSVRYKS